jgi:chromosome segregation protein
MSASQTIDSVRSGYGDVEFTARRTRSCGLLPPSPFCLLDEVDAPLDEANIGRCCEAIRAMTQHSQFIVITHSKKTMQLADVLYGATMEQPGVSKLVSVELKKLERKVAPAPQAAPAVA